MRDRFARLLNGFTTLVARSAASSAPSTAKIRALLDQFEVHRRRAEAQESTQAAEEHTRFKTFLAGYSVTVERYRRQQEAVAEDFNLLEVMRLTGKEIRHSMVLAWLLDHDLRKLGTHAQGKLGFQLFLQEFGLPITYADCNYWVRREVAGDESIVDVEIACRGRFIIHIENKIWSGEGGDDQTLREWADLKRRASDLNVNPDHVHALFLTPRGTKPVCDHFKPIRWGRVVNVLNAFTEKAKPSDVQLFTRHYAQALRRFIVGQDTSEDTHGESTVE